MNGLDTVTIATDQPPFPMAGWTGQDASRSGESFFCLKWSFADPEEAKRRRAESERKRLALQERVEALELQVAEMEERLLVRASMAMSEGPLRRVWDNPQDDAYNDL